MPTQLDRIEKQLEKIDASIHDPDNGIFSRIQALHSSQAETNKDILEIQQKQAQIEFEQNDLQKAIIGFRGSLTTLKWVAGVVVPGIGVVLLKVFPLIW